jgi:pimeloyl-ACP methyl ester carboxylesterase
MSRIVYLHGFASSPLSTKAQFFLRKFTDLGVDCQIPQLDRHDFSGLTITNQLSVIEEAVQTDRVTLMGSSLGGYLAALYAARHPNIDRLILLAPAFQFPTRWHARFTAGELAEWKRAGSRNFYHYGYKRDQPLGYRFVEDAVQYEDDPDFKQPALIVHGVHDDVVPVEASRSFVLRHPNARLCVIESGHELTDSLDRLWNETAGFIEECSCDSK